MFTRQQAQNELGMGSGAFLDAAEWQQKHGYLLIKPAPSCYVIVPRNVVGSAAAPDRVCHFHLADQLRELCDARPWYRLRPVLMRRECLPLPRS